MGSPGSCGEEPRCNSVLIKGCASKLTTQVLSVVAPAISGNGDSSRRPQQRRLVSSARQQRTETDDTHAKNRLSKEPQPAARNFWQHGSCTKQTTRRQELDTQTALANSDGDHRGRAEDLAHRRHGGSVAVSSVTLWSLKPARGRSCRSGRRYAVVVAFVFKLPAAVRWDASSVCSNERAGCFLRRPL